MHKETKLFDYVIHKSPTLLLKQRMRRCPSGTSCSKASAEHCINLIFHYHNAFCFVTSALLTRNSTRTGGWPGYYRGLLPPPLPANHGRGSSYRVAHANSIS